MYSQEQLNTLENCYQEEIKKLLIVKANYSLAILSIKTQLTEKDKKIAELETELKSVKPKK